MSINKYYNLAKNTLYPICRSLTGKGTKKTLSILKNEFPSLKIYKVSSRSKVFDWNVPDEWNVSDAYVLDKKSNKIIDFKSLLIGVLITTIIFLIMGQTQTGFLRVQRLEVVDKNGAVVIKLGSVKNNGSIETYNDAGNLIVGITSSVDGEGVINTYNANEKQIVKLGSTTDGPTALRVVLAT